MTNHLSPLRIRRPFDAISTNFAKFSPAQNRKRRKKMENNGRILAFDATDHAGKRRIEMGSTRTLEQIADLLYYEKTLGNEANHGNDENYNHHHNWKIKDMQTNETYESSHLSTIDQSSTVIGSIEAGCVVGSELLFQNECGASCYSVTLRLISITDHNNEDEENILDEELSSFLSSGGESLLFQPVEELNAEESNFNEQTPPHSTNNNMDEMFPDLSKFLFESSSQGIAIHLFQPRNKKKHQAFISKVISSQDTRSHMIYAPERFESVDGLLSALDEGCREKPLANSSCISFGLTLFPKSIVPNTTAWKRFDKYKAAQHADVDRTAMAVSEDGPLGPHYGKFVEAFPKCAAAAGYPKAGGKPKPTERGWIVYSNGVLKVCRGDALPQPHFPYPSPGVWDGMDQHNPFPYSILAQMQKEITSLQELFTCAEELFTV